MFLYKPWSNEIDFKDFTIFLHTGEDLQAASAASNAHRRRTDLMPTITYSTASPSGSRLGTPHKTPTTRSPGKAVSMSRLDLLARPRQPRTSGSATPAAPPALSLHANPKTSPARHHPPPSSSSGTSRSVSRHARSMTNSDNERQKRKSISMSHLAMTSKPRPMKLTLAKTPSSPSKKGESV